MPVRFFYVFIIMFVAGVRGLAEPDTHAAHGASFHATGERGIVATSHPLATQAGIAAMERGAMPWMRQLRRGSCCRW